MVKASAHKPSLWSLQLRHSISACQMLTASVCKYSTIHLRVVEDAW